jgi:hypothetical protein
LLFARPAAAILPYRKDASASLLMVSIRVAHETFPPFFDSSKLHC